MAMKMQIRGTQLNAFYASAWKNYSRVNAGNVTLLAGAGTGIFGSSLIDITNGGSNNGGVTYIGADNCSLNGAFSMLWRINPTWTGNPATASGLVQIGSADGNGFGFGIARITTASKVNIVLKDTLGNTVANVDSPSAIVFTAGTLVDIWVTWDGTTAAGALQFYSALNGNTASSLGTGACSPAISTRDKASVPSITFGQNEFASTGANYKLNEFVMFDTQVDPTTYGTRIDFITASAYEGYVYTDPGIANVKNGTAYTFNGNSLTGTLAASGGSSGPPDVRLGTGEG